MTDQEIAAALADADGEFTGDTALQFARLLADHVRALAAEVTKLRAERDEAQRIADLRLDDVARAVELAVRLSFVRNERDRLLETVAEVQMQADEAYEAMHANRARVRVVEKERNAALNERDRLREAMRYIAEHVQPGVAVSKAIEALGEVKP